MKPVQLDTIRRVLVIKWSALGDVVIASALMEDIARALPHAEIHLNTQPNCTGLFAHDPRFAEVWAIDVRSKTHRWANSLAWLKKVRAGRYDLVIDLQRSDHSRFLLTLLWLSGGAPRIRIGNRGGFPYTHQPADRDPQAHALPMMQSVLQAIGIPTPTSHPVLYPAPERMAVVNALRQKHGLTEGRYVVLLPGSQAAGKLKRWGAARFAELARLLHAQGVAKIVIIGGPDEVDECAEIAAAGDYVVNLNGQLQLLDIAPLCAGACGHHRQRHRHRAFCVCRRAPPAGAVRSHRPAPRQAHRRQARWRCRRSCRAATVTPRSAATPTIMPA